MERHIPVTGEIYRHFKNKLYQIVTVATHSETGERLVVYQALYGDFSCCARPLEMFLSEVDHDKYPEVTARYRFEQVDKETLTPVHAKASVYTNESSENNNKDANVVEVLESKNIDANTDEVLESKNIDADVDENGEVNGDLLAFLEAETFEEKRNVLVYIRPRITDELINSMAASLDVTVEDGDLETRYMSLYNCVSTFEKYEVNNRLR